MYSPKTGKQTSIDKFCNLRERCRTAERNNQRTSPQQSDCLPKTFGHLWEPSKTSQPLNSFLASQTLLRIAERSVASVTSEEAGLGVAPHSAPQPVSSWRTTTIAWTSALFGRTPSVSHHLPSRGRLLPAGGQVARRLPGRHSSVTASPLPDWTSCGAQRVGKTATWCPQVAFCPLGHAGRIVGTATPLREHRRLGQCFAPQLTYPASSWEQESHLPYTPTGRLR